MNRKQNCKWLFLSLIAVASLNMFGSAANAQQVKGSFTLPYAVHWGHATLGSGRYTFETEPNGKRYLLMVRGKHGNAFVMARTANPNAAGESSLRVIRRGNQATISSVHLAPTGVTFEYVAPGREQGNEEAANHSPGPRSVRENALATTASIEIPLSISGQ